MKVSIVLPTYNEAGNIVNLIQSIKEQKYFQSFTLEFIVVDDNSPDGTASVVRQAATTLPIKLFVRTRSRGLASAILYGIKKAKGNIIVLMDTDFNHRPQDLVKLVKHLLGSHSDLVIGSRYISGGGMHDTEASKLQFLGSKYGNLLVNRLLLGLPVHESLSGFLVFKKQVLSSLPLQSIFTGYGDYCIRLLYALHDRGCSLSEYPVIYGKRQYGQSKSHLLKMFAGYFKTALQLKLKPHSSRPRA